MVSNEIGYFAMVPLDDERMTKRWDGLGALPAATQSMNQLGIAIADHGDDKSINQHFLTCRMWNTSLFLNISYLNDVQAVRPESFTYINEVQPLIGLDDFPDQTINVADLVYTTFFWGVCEQLTGLVVATFSAPFYDLSNEANIKDTTLTGASEFLAMMKNPSSFTSTAFLRDLPPLNKSLSALIEDVSLDASLNMLSDGILRHSTPLVLIIIFSLTSHLVLSLLLMSPIPSSETDIHMDTTTSSLHTASPYSLLFFPFSWAGLPFPSMVGAMTPMSHQSSVPLKPPM